MYIYTVRLQPVTIPKVAASVKAQHIHTHTRTHTQSFVNGADVMIYTFRL